MTAGGSTPAQRIWGGTTLSDRQAQRRTQLLDAGLELLGTQGSAAISVRSVCRQARLTDRYFYENFADRADFVRAVYDRVAAEAAGALVAVVAAGGDDATVAAESVRAFVALIADDPRKGRVLLLEPLTDPVLGQHGVAVAAAFAEIVRSQLRPSASASEAALVATAIVGALTNLFIRWLDGSQPIARDELEQFCLRLLVNAAALAE